MSETTRIIQVKIRDRVATPDQGALYVCGNSDFSIVFDFDEEWANWETKTARFDYGYERADIVFTGDRCPVPVISNTTHFYVGVYAGDLCTTTPAYVSARKSILCGGTLPPAPAPDVYAQIMKLLNAGMSDEQLAQAIEAYMLEHPFDGVTPDELDEAVQNALQVAKESGEFDGPAGPQGEQGPKGDTGDTGPQGPQGEKGDTGPAGADGAKGDKGDKGDTGDTGATGPAGANGSDGVSCTHSWNGTTLTVTSASGTSSADLKGEKGDKGDTGATGQQGEKGETGATGSEGPQGPQGDPGPAGADGAKGDKGDKGDTGAAGYSPVRGTDYWTASDIAEIKGYVDAAILNGSW